MVEVGRSSAPVDRLAAALAFREEARREGFAAVGIARAGTPPGHDRFLRWLQGGHHAGMAYLEASRDVRGDPTRLLPAARSVVCLSVPHDSRDHRASDGSRVARYARGADYHGTLRRRTERVAEAVARRVGEFSCRVCVDSTPISERAFAAAAGLGWIGKNGCLIDPELGSYVLLSEIVTDLDLPADEPVVERCGTCTRCLDACPTGAFLSPGLLDANRCLAYWTIEHRGPLPDRIKDEVGDRVFGCDACQEACPWNAPIPGGDLASESVRPDLPTRAEWLAMGPGEWRRRFGATALNRAGRRGVQRNAAASAGAARDERVSPWLARASQTGDAGLSDAARWAGRRLARG